MDINNKKATRQSYGEALVELGKVNKDVIVLDADLAGATKTNMFAKEFPDRFFDLGIAEQDMIATWRPPCHWRVLHSHCVYCTLLELCPHTRAVL